MNSFIGPAPGSLSTPRGCDRGNKKQNSNKQGGTKTLITSEMITDALNGGQTHKQILEQIDLALAQRPMIKVAFNRCYGGYGISHDLAKKAGLEVWDRSREARTNSVVIEAIETDPKLASGDCASLAVMSVPCDANWWIDEYDGIESVMW